jgi:hypothetical protein
MEAITNAWLGLTKLKNISIYIILQPMKKRSNMHPCTSKALHTICIYGGKEEFSHIIGILSKMIFFKDSRASRKKKFFSKLSRLQQKGSIDEFTHQWEALTTRLFGLYDD